MNKKIFHKTWFWGIIGGSITVLVFFLSQSGDTQNTATTNITNSSNVTVNIIQNIGDNNENMISVSEENENVLASQSQPTSTQQKEKKSTRILENKIFRFSVDLPENGVWDFNYNEPSKKPLEFDLFPNHVDTVTIEDTSIHRNLNELIQIEIFTEPEISRQKILEQINIIESEYTFLAISQIKNKPIFQLEYIFNLCNDKLTGGLYCNKVGNIELRDNNDALYLIHVISSGNYSDPLPKISDNAKLISNSFDFLN